MDPTRWAMGGKQHRTRSESCTVRGLFEKKQRVINAVVAETCC